MNSEEIMFQQYRLYTEQKEKFVDRSFHTNKFYLLVVLGLFLIMFLLKGFAFAFDISAILVFSAAGMAICVLWWINMDAYNFLIKVKLGKVIEEIEKQLPSQPYTQEFLAIKDLRKNKRMFLFADMQKILAIFAFLTFLILFVNEVIPLFIIK
ncbi:MAG TPA: hypothetical protein PLG15_00145 [Candidatus Gastranaerophilaceae bacterium]|nr:hypothetical protein [Candidatus Gastranaerophilaceae bacterium]HPT40776.1 hypothetical protein [Candidatus Gastranaerophilaceae bacterium]